MTELPRHARRRVATAIVCVIVGNLRLRHARTWGSVPRTHSRGSGTDVEVPAASGKIKERRGLIRIVSCLEYTYNFSS